jgi:hypothetical protein
MIKDVIGPVYFSVSNSGSLKPIKHWLKYKGDIEALKKEALMSPGKNDVSVVDTSVRMKHQFFQSSDFL